MIFSIEASQVMMYILCVNFRGVLVVGGGVEVILYCVIFG